jgi:REP element-mobilizing transposase RayT
MARPLRIVYPGVIYHVTIRGNGQKELFLDEEDRRLMQQKLAASVARCQVRLYAYLFMRNHLPLLIETPRANLSRFMQHFSTAYTVSFNRCHRRRILLRMGGRGAAEEPRSIQGARRDPDETAEGGSRSGVDFDHREPSLWSRTAGTAPTAFVAAGAAVSDPAAGGGGGAEWPGGGTADGVGQLGRREPSSAGIGG